MKTGHDIVDIKRMKLNLTPSLDSSRIGVDTCWSTIELIPTPHKISDLLLNGIPSTAVQTPSDHPEDIGLKQRMSNWTLELNLLAGIMPSRSSLVSSKDEPLCHLGHSAPALERIGGLLWWYGHNGTDSPVSFLRTGCCRKDAGIVLVRGIDWKKYVLQTAKYIF